MIVVPQRAVRRLIFDGSRRSIADLSKVRNEPWSRLHVRTSRYYRYYRSEFWTRNSFETLSEFCVFFQRRFWCCWSGSLVRSMINCMRQKSLVRILWSVLFLQKRLMFHVIWRCDPHFPKVQEGYEEFATVPVLMSCCIKVMWKTHIYMHICLQYFLCLLFLHDVVKFHLSKMLHNCACIVKLKLYFFRWFHKLVFPKRNVSFAEQSIRCFNTLGMQDCFVSTIWTQNHGCHRC